MKLNGFAEGVTGEDADMTIRVGRLGYKIVSDPAVRAYTEMPSTFGYLREQRMRWARGTYHMLARNWSGIVMMQGLRCVWMLPWAGFIMFRRLMVRPFRRGGVRPAAAQPRADPAAGSRGRRGDPARRPAHPDGRLHALRRRPRLIASIPSYFIFRLIVSFFALETLLSLAFDPAASQPARRPAGRPAGRSSTSLQVCAIHHASIKQSHERSSRNAILDLGGDGYLGWPTAMHFSARGTRSTSWTTTCAAARTRRRAPTR